MATYVTSLDVSLNESEEQLLMQKGFKKLPANLNQGAGGNNIHLWYKQGSEAITRVQATFNTEMCGGLISTGFTKIPKNLNAGVWDSSQIFLWYFRGSGEYDIPIVAVDVTTGAETGAANFRHGWERVSCDLNRNAGGAWIHIWVQREKPTFICDVTATDSFTSDTYNFSNGYIRLDEDTNRGAGGSFVFIWYRQTTNSKLGLTGLDVSTSDDQYYALQQQGYKPVSVNLNEGTKGQPVYLWYKKDQHNNPIKAVGLLLNPAAAQEYIAAGATVIQKNLNSGNNGFKELLSYFQ